MASYHLTHVSRFGYALPVAVSQQSGYLRPLTTSNQEVEKFTLTITPRPSEITERADYFGNNQLHFQIEERHKILEVTAESKVTVKERVAIDATSTPSCDDVRATLLADTSPDNLRASLMTHPSLFTRCGEPLEVFAAKHLAGDRPYLEAARALNEAIYTGFEFDPDATDLRTPVDEVYQKRRGVCQDFLHLMLACLRSQRLPARYVSGYILTHPPEGQPRLQGADASHAWVSVWIPEYGWIDLDPTNNIFCREEHITVACGRDYADVNPLRGAVTGGGHHDIEIAVTMTPEVSGI